MDPRYSLSCSSQLSSPLTLSFPGSGSSLFIKNLKNLKKFNLHSINSNKNQFEIFSRLYNRYESSFIFESLTGPRELAETSIIGFDPLFTIQCDTRNFTVIDNKKMKIIKEMSVTEPLEQLRSIIPKITNTEKNKKTKKYRYTGGAVGYVSYDAIRFWEKLPKPKKKILDFPLLEFGIFTDGILYNNLEKQAYYFCTRRKKNQELTRLTKLLWRKRLIKTIKVLKTAKNL